MSKRPLLWMVGAFVCGILSVGDRKWALFPAMVLVLFLLWVCERNMRSASRLFMLILLTVFFSFGSWRRVQDRDFREAYMEKLCDGDAITIQGEIYKKEPKQNQYFYYLKNCHAVLSNQVYPTNPIIAYIPEDSCKIGQTIVLEGKVSLFPKATNEGNFDLQDYYASLKIDFAVKNSSITSVHGREKRLPEWLYRLRGRLSDYVDAYLSPVEAGVLSAMLWGDKSLLSTDTRQLYQNAGISHILAISGLHVSLIGMTFFNLMRRLGGHVSTSAGTTILLLLCYYTMTGQGISAFRAICMLGISLLARLIGRSYDLPTAMAVAAFLLLYGNTGLLANSGFLLSFGAVTGVAAANEIRAKQDGNDEEASFFRKRCRALVDGLRMSARITGMTLPIVSAIYYEVPLYSILLNAVVLPLLPLILISALLGTLAGMVWSLPAKLLFSVSGLGLWVYNTLSDFTLSLPFCRIITGRPEVWQITVYYAILALGFLLSKKQYENRRTVFQRILPGILPAIAGFVLLLPKASASGFEISVLDVGQGDGIYLSTGDGKSLFVDGGSSNVKQVAKNRILPFLKSRGIGKITCWFVTHGDEDHTSGILEAYADGYPIESMVLARGMPRDANFRELMEAAARHGTKVLFLAPGEVLCVGESRITCLSPDAGTSIGYGTNATTGTNTAASTNVGGETDVAKDSNDASLVFLYEEGGFRGFFGGDISSKREKGIIGNVDLPKVHFFKANHHGSNYSNSSELLNTLEPEVIAVSCALRNLFRHPGEKAVMRMEEVCDRVEYTMHSGQIRIFYREGKIVTEPFRK